MWLGALFSFIGSWIQNVAQAWLVYELTHDEAKLAFVAFCGSAPVAFIGPAAGTLADMFDKRKVLIICQCVFAGNALFLAAATHFGFVRYEYILVCALILGVAGSIEMPTRQSVVSRVVPQEDLPSAVPLQAMTFNLARVIGPSIGGILLASVGPKLCYLVNGLSYSFLIGAAIAIRTNLKAVAQEASGMKELILEGIRFTLRDERLRTLFIMESIVSTFGLFYLALMAAIADKILKVDERGLGFALTVIGVGAIIGLLGVANKGNSRTRGWIVRIAMVVMGLALIALALAPNRIFAFVALGFLGMASILQFNTTNTLFQLISPERLRGRVIAMHVWALSGLGPFGTLFFGWLARQTSIPLALMIGGSVVLAGAIWGFSRKSAFEDLP